MSADPPGSDPAGLATATGRAAARDLLAFYLEAGVDALLAEEPVDRLRPEEVPEQVFAQARAPAPAREAAPPTLRTPAVRPALDRGGNLPGMSTAHGPGAPAGSPAGAPAAPEEAVMAAREAARSAATLDELAAILARFEGCALKATATRLCFADGTPGAPVMFVGEAPGRDEDIEGLPFVGRSGKLLDRMMAAIGLDRHAPGDNGAYIANVVPWRPPGNRTPTPLETQTCLPFVLRQIELADPDILVCLGAPAAQTLIGTKEGIMRTRGRWFTIHTGKREIRAIATLHPAYLLRQPLAKRLAWRDFLAVKAALAERTR
ncbi:MAG: uracil-DNA glycosylase [Rhodoplanes sp.]|uniref:uracil-DNA glycosylase n=1 Tax=Rhodoplanes sp. TaxID=1968906 RepID=UPI00179C41EF|nr:uracil-DNA glycosylase [Rhodoplanes sp.]NVO17171.1 uracil-DNA glycosylase [Rhodoplanes sp.]